MANQIKMKEWAWKWYDGGVCDGDDHQIQKPERERESNELIQAQL